MPNEVNPGKTKRWKKDRSPDGEIGFMVRFGMSN
jgi:hypothetical protein